MFSPTTPCLALKEEIREFNSSPDEIEKGHFAE
jgi:hypothetical protein